MPFPVSERHANAVLHIGLFRRDANGVFVPVTRARDPGGVGRATRQHRFKEEIMGTGWPRPVVAEGNLFVQTAALRQILGAAQPGQSCTQTEIGRVIDLSRR
jgi:hypothetical protein